MGDEDFRKLFERLVDYYELNPKIADKLRRRILKILYGDREDLKKF